MKQDSNEFFNDVFGSVSATNDVRAVFSLAECLASYDHMDVSIDYMVSAILYYYRDFEPNSIVAQLYPADDYYLELKKAFKSENLFFGFSQRKAYAILPTQHFPRCGYSFCRVV